MSLDKCIKGCHHWHFYLPQISMIINTRDHCAGFGFIPTKEIEGSPPVVHHGSDRITRTDHQRLSSCIFFRRLLTASGPGVGSATSKRCARHVCCFSHMVGGREGFTLLSGETHKGQLGQWRGGYRPLQSDSANGLPRNKAPAILHFCRFFLSACMHVLGSRLLMVGREVEKRKCKVTKNDIGAEQDLH